MRPDNPRPVTRCLRRGGRDESQGRRGDARGVWLAGCSLAAGCPSPSIFNFTHTTSVSATAEPDSSGEATLPTTGTSETTETTETSGTTDAGGSTTTAGYACGAPCTKAAELRVFAPGGAQISQASLPANVLAPLDLAYHPAGFVVLASGRQQGNDTVFVVQARDVAANGLIWSYEHQGAPASEVATAVTIGRYGQVYAGGISAFGYPAIAYIAP